MDPTQKNNLDNAMPSEGAIGNAAGADNSVSASASVNAGIPVSSGMPVDVGNSVSASAPVNAGRFSALTGAKRYNSSMNAGQFANPARGAVGMVGQTIGSVEQPTFALGSNQPIISSDAGIDMGNPGMSLNPSMEGVAVHNGGGSKTKKLWIVGSVIGAILVVCIAVIAVVMNNGGGANSPSDSNSEINRQYGISNYKEAVNAFANYILFDKQSIEEVQGDYDPGVLYPIWKAAREDDVEFFNLSKELFDNVLSWANNNASSDDVVMDRVLLMAYKNVFDYYYLYNTIDDITFEDVLKKYYEVGMDTTTKWIEDFYNGFGESSELSQTYLDLRKKDNLLNLNIIANAESYGCIKEMKLDYNCLNGTETADWSMEKERINRMTTSMLHDARSEVVSDCFDFARHEEESSLSLRINKELEI